MSKEENSAVVFGIGLLAGVLGGVLGGVLFAPKSGKESREDIKKVIEYINNKYAPEIRMAKKQAMTSIDVMKYRLEKEYNRLNEMFKAKQLAKAKELENRDCDFN